MVFSGDTQATVSGDTSVPKKLRDDAIYEAVCQLQFRSDDIPEIVLGRLSDAERWKDYVPSRLPFADIPAPVRNADPNLKLQATFELRSKDGTRIVRLNEFQLSYHIVGVRKYCGWKQFRSELEGAVEAILQQLKNPRIEKLSLRYINAINSARHMIPDVHHLNLEVRVADVKIDGPINLNYVVEDSPHHATTTRIAHHSFVHVQQGTLPEGTSAVVDVEVTSPGKLSRATLPEVMKWIEAAHAFEKVAFFKLIPPAILQKLKEE